VLPYLWISAGAVLGANLRYLTGRLMAQALGTGFPYGTFVVNVVGCFLAGLFGLLVAHRLVDRPEVVRQFMVIGFLGSLTTFSSFSYETLALAQDGALARAAANVALSLTAGLGGVWLGELLAVRLGL